MSMKVLSYQLTCDGAVCSEEWVRASISGSSRTGIRQAAKERGWMRVPKKDDEPGADLCPRCSAVPR